jgi:sentrin-specific protease 1
VATASVSARMGGVLACTSVHASAAAGRAVGATGLFLAKRSACAVLREYNRRHPREPRFPRRDSATLFCRLKCKAYPVSWDEDVDEAAAAQLADDMRRAALPDFFREPLRVKWEVALEGKDPFGEFITDFNSFLPRPEKKPTATPSAPRTIASDRKASPPAASTTRWLPYNKLRAGLTSRFAQKNRKIKSHSARTSRKRATQEISPAVSEDFSGMMSIIQDPTSPSPAPIDQAAPQPEIAESPSLAVQVTSQPAIAQTPVAEQSNSLLDFLEQSVIAQTASESENTQNIHADQVTPQPAIAQSMLQTPATDISSTCNVTPPLSAASDISSTCDVTPIPATPSRSANILVASTTTPIAAGTYRSPDVTVDSPTSNSPSPKASPMPGAWTEEEEASEEGPKETSDEDIPELRQSFHHMQLRSRKTVLPRTTTDVAKEDTAAKPAPAITNIPKTTTSISTPKGARYGSDKVTVANDVQKKLDAAKQAEQKYGITEVSQAWKSRVRDAVRNGAGGLQATDFARVVPPTASSSRGTDLWLNDEIINAYLKIVSEHGKRHDDKFAKAPSHHAFASYFYTNIADSSKGPKFVARWSKRANINGTRLLETECVFIPINSGAHWTLCVVSGRNKTITAYDSLNGSAKAKLNIILNWVKFELEKEFKEDEWMLINGQTSQQTNSDDCGVFTITNARQLMLGLEPKDTFNASKVRIQRERIVAEVLNGALIEG